MIRRAKLYARVNDGSRIPVEFRGDRAIEPKPHGGLIISYAVRIAGKFEHAGSTLQEAVATLRQRQAQIGSGVLALPATEPTLPTTAAPGRTPLLQSAEEYKATLQTLDKAKATVLVYKNALDGFLASCKKEFVEDIDRKDILQYIGWMKENLSTRVAGGQNRTINNRLVYLGTFLNEHGVKLFKDHNRNSPSDPGLLMTKDRLKVVKKAPKKYSRENLDLLMKRADIDQKDYLELLLWSGFRDEEVQFLTYADFDWRNHKVGVHAKPQYGWRPKDHEERDVNIPSAVVERMKERKERYKRKDEDLVFPNGDGRPDSHLIYRLHAVAKRAGLNLKGQRAGHMFRKTAGSRVAKRDGLRAAMKFLGHSDIDTTALYLADDDDPKKAKQSTEDAYQAFANGD